MKEDIILRICKEYAKRSKGIPIEGGILEISLDDFVRYIKWDCENACLYYPDLVNPPPIMGLKVTLKKNGRLKIKIKTFKR